MQRQLGRDTILIVDALNYMKGFRYQLYFASREFKFRVCTVSSLVYSQMVVIRTAYTAEVCLRCRYGRTMQTVE
jgi:tRNA uridine 5-carbamoylmethylation protein Kti12